jgi:hypothetical protein
MEHIMEADKDYGTRPPLLPTFARSIGAGHTHWLTPVLRLSTNYEFSHFK